jgi:Protein of unknown function (DUF3050)
VCGSTLGADALSCEPALRQRDCPGRGERRILGAPISQVEIYLEAMEQVKADTRAIRHIIGCARVDADRLSFEGVPVAAKEFVETTFGVIHRGSSAQAAAFAFGREDAIPDMFRSLVRQLNQEMRGELDQFVWYRKGISRLMVTTMDRCR